MKALNVDYDVLPQLEDLDEEIVRPEPTEDTAADRIGKPVERWDDGDLWSYFQMRYADLFGAPYHCNPRSSTGAVERQTVRMFWEKYGSPNAGRILMHIFNVDRGRVHDRRVSVSNLTPNSDWLIQPVFEAMQQRIAPPKPGRYFDSRWTSAAEIMAYLKS